MTAPLSFSTLPPLWLQIAITGAWIGMLGLLAEWLHRYTSVGSEVVRKVVHIGAGNVILLAWWLQVPVWLGIGASVVFSTIAFLSYRLPILPGINGVGRNSLGTFFYAVSIGLLVAWFWTIQQPHYAAIGVLVMTWGDGLAALVGQRFGKHPYKLWDMQKSWEGSLTMAIVSGVVSLLILLAVRGNIWQTWVVALAVAIVATGLEAFSKFGIDNLTVPLGSATLCFILCELLLPG
ncbi:diacylglycerol/polyprenol kinase family protein [Stenomitos frigidus]|uniref:Phosphatidate cytidylyltransferase n=1 Tax=Stenomitos frigidus ULC18 TaxID=2107698 RepID=A0A2T1DTK7_9CYAN|nr:diacylglycerol/polyprenol kinase family protein [Stenomitos frigidus]PSB23704.1 phosphatidate cytidylyltransferase [Stenomitos frigidus ULC18]